MLPSFIVSLSILVAATALLAFLLTQATRGISILAATATLPVALISAALVTGLVRRADEESIVSVRRVFGLYFISTLIWIITVLLGIAFSNIGFPRSSANEFILGAFLVWCFELIVINGAFLSSTLKSFFLAGIHPVSLLALDIPWLGKYDAQYYAVLSGVVVLLLITVYILRLKSLQTNRRINSVRLLQAFLKTWVSKRPRELEGYFAVYAEDEQVHTDIFLLESGGKKTTVILPGIHPGPFFPVGSYNISELLYRKISSVGVIPLVLHGIGGHERNAATNESTNSYTKKVSDYISSLAIDSSSSTRIRGPLRSKAGIFNITTLAIKDKVLAIISNAPYDSDDVNPKMIPEASAAAAELRLTVSIVDAHNSIGGEMGQLHDLNRTDWKNILNSIMAMPENELLFGYAHSSEIAFEHGADISEGGIGLLIFEVDSVKSVLITADSNNAVSGLREKIEQELNHDGFELLELCTSDTHSLAARRLISRGYFALGEDSSEAQIIGAIKRMATIAEGRISPGAIKVADFSASILLVGGQSLDEFAKLTKNAVSYSKRYMTIAIPVVLLLVAAMLFY